MARGRFLSKSISTNERFTTVSDRARILWLMGLPHADVDGLLPGSPGELGALVVPSLLLAYRWTIPDVETSRDELVAAGLWELKADAFQRQVIEICRFKDHQSLQIEKEGKSRFLGVRPGRESTPDRTPEPTPESTPDQDVPRGGAQVKLSQEKRREGNSSARAREDAPPLDRPPVSGARRSDGLMLLRTVGSAWAKVHPLGEDYALTDFDQKAVIRFAHRIPEIKDLEGFLRRAAAACTKPTLERALEKLNDPEIVNGRPWASPLAAAHDDTLDRLRRENEAALAEAPADPGSTRAAVAALRLKIGRPVPAAQVAERDE